MPLRPTPTPDTSTNANASVKVSASPNAGPLPQAVAPNAAFWSEPAAGLLRQLGSSPQGLSAAQAQARLRRDGPNTVAATDQRAAGRLLLRQFSSPLVLILVFGALLSFALRDWLDGAIILTIVAGSALLGFSQEYRASNAVAALRQRLALTVRARRDGQACTLPVADLVAGDVVELSAGNLVPADGLILAARDFLVSQASLTGESMPVEKQPGLLPAQASLAQRHNCAYMGSSVRSGTATVLVVHTGRHTAFGAVAARLRQAPADTEFTRGVRQFGLLLVWVMLGMVVFVLAINQMLGRPPVASWLFAVALAVGISPELLPAIVSVTLARGARLMAERGVIVRRLDAIENLGSMSVLCTDKTGTLTHGVMALDSAVDASGAASAQVLALAHLNAFFETGISNPLDAALVAAGQARGLGTQDWAKVDELPYDFQRKRLTIVLQDQAGPAGHLMVTKGAFNKVLEVCSHWRAAGGALQPLDEAVLARLTAWYGEQGARGLRLIALASSERPAQPRYCRDDEAGLVFEGFVQFADPPKAQAAQTVRDLRARGVQVKVITGDNRHVAAHVGAAIGLDPQALLTGEALHGMRDEALWHLAPRTDLFVEVDPQQKERIVRALQRVGHAVGYLGDGINDAPALHAADVGISIDQAVDVARESADVVLLRPDLDVLRQGVDDGRRSFANTLKYIGITTSANFGNMLSMALATPLLPFLPLAATQILLNNFLSDLPAMAIATDRVDPDRLASPVRWNMAQLRGQMLQFGAISTVFDLLSFALLLQLFQAQQPLFQTAWFSVSLLSELAVLLVLRSHGPAWRSPPSPLLAWAVAAVAVLALALPYSGALATLFGFVALPAPVLAMVLAIVIGYALVTEWAKRLFWARAQHPPAPGLQG